MKERTAQEEAKLILTDLGENPNMSLEEIKDYLKTKWRIYTKVTKMSYNPNYGEEDEWNRDGWAYDDYYDEEPGNDDKRNWFTEDFNRYLTQDEAEWWSVVEGLAFVSLYLVKKKR